MGDPLDLASGDERLAELASVAQVLFKHIVRIANHDHENEN